MADIKMVGAASSRDKPWQHGYSSYFAAGSRSHRVKIIAIESKYADVD
jgi:hypothetical protein